MFGPDEGESLQTASSALEHFDKPATSADHEAAVMARNGITRIPANHYHVEGYRYTNLADALAQVRRGARGREASR